MTIERDEINEVGRRIQALLMDSEDAIILSVAAEARNADCELQSCTVAITGNVAGIPSTFTGNAVGLYDAACVARGKLRIARELHAEKLAKEKAKKEAATCQ